MLTCAIVQLEVNLTRVSDTADKVIFFWFIETLKLLACFKMVLICQMNKCMSNQKYHMVFNLDIKTNDNLVLYSVRGARLLIFANAAI